jgi:hypothetical protein
VKEAFVAGRFAADMGRCIAFDTARNFDATLLFLRLGILFDVGHGARRDSIFFQSVGHVFVFGSLMLGKILSHSLRFA